MLMRQPPESIVQWIPRVEDTQDKILRDVRAVTSACPAYTRSCILPITDKNNVQARALVSACYGVLLNRGIYPLYS